MNKLFYVIGASGAGKDTLMNYARTRINGSATVIFAHRYITRPAFTGNENHVFLSNEEFNARIAANLFALHWESHGQQYGIGAEINTWMESGFNVVVNGSRQYLPIAQQIYPDLKVILIEANAEAISSRLAERGRESTAEIKKRIARNAEINADLKNCITIQNNGTIEDAGEVLVNIISLPPKPVTTV
ncbi:phosphonate metabolism protein/1,5-bisphosphokinase (PRPP-forming) PhnN [Mucilaginibacter sp. SP1R1]|uniref:phosphonate metabolism protein/1,5-bisphosphokinase (PRPP-forming) PhnN n=1 Tax=Mucilaginibacter sp. SP1R1 TaxID=2723091 RepID=UPI00160BB06E|nr:phosphonate metabolism protein/1,5-bisphosphokinase (PRPP-forming) PhnN [Mucilaginibacter sp. SP1R1]MBB6151164.1 ribose 1,5-bisphosphokinase [Mucilaginibacter sp. SP1R1]